MSSRFDAVIQEFLRETLPTSSKPVRLGGLDGLDRQCGVPPDAPVTPKPCSVSAEPAFVAPRHVAEALPFLGLPLDMFAHGGTSLEVRVRWLDVTLWIAPGDRDAAQLMAEGVGRGRIWTAAELLQLITIADRKPGTVKTITHAKLVMDGDIITVRRRPDSDLFMR